jgi:hypothetical protein
MARGGAYNVFRIIDCLYKIDSKRNKNDKPIHLNISKFLSHLSHSFEANKIMVPQDLTQIGNNSLL